ncbi:2-hydroxyacyl-CoA dehydratase subunit D [Thermodesulfobacteriota bacterium]
MGQSNSTGLARASEIYENRGEIAHELKAEGKKVIGYLCAYPALELLTAMDYVPYRVLGTMDEPITKADLHVPSIICAVLRSQLDLGLKGKYDFLEGFVGVHTCDCGEKFCHLWNSRVPLPYDHFIDFPHVVHEDSFAFLKDGLKVFQESLEEFSGKKLDPGRLKQEIARHNAQRAKVRELYELRKQDPPLVSGTEVLKVVLSLLTMPIDDGTRLVQEVIDEVKTRQDGPTKKGARLMIWGTPMTEVKLVEMIENLDASVVMDDICTGSRHWWPDVEITDDPLDGMAKRYLEDIKCPRTFRDSKNSYEEEQESRFGYLAEYVRDWSADGVLLISVKYCDTHGYEVPTIMAYFDRLGVPNMYLEHEYTMVATAPLQTRVEAFLEMIA